jgi:hypothetical protein
MASYSVETKLSPEEAVVKAVSYFGPDVGKLEIVEQEACCARLEGGGGFVQVRAAHEDHGTTVYLETREWDAYVHQFMKLLSQADA